MKRRECWILAAACVLAMLCGIGERVEAVTVERTVTNVTDSTDVDVEFTVPQEDLWIWWLTAETADGWHHKPGRQTPDKQPWVPSDFSGDSGYWKNANVSDSSPSKNFQQDFYGELLRDAGAGTGGEPPDFDIHARSGEYFIEPEYPFAQKRGQQCRFQINAPRAGIRVQACGVV